MKLDDTHPDYFTDSDNDNQNSSPDTARKITFEGSPVEGDATGSDKPGTNPSVHRNHRMRKVLAWVILVALLALGVFVWMRYYNPFVVEARMKCYVLAVEKRGLIFKTYEVDVVSEAALTDTARIYSKEEDLSVPSEELASELMKTQGTGRPVVLQYKTYNGALPWRGASKSVVTAIISE